MECNQNTAPLELMCFARNSLNPKNIEHSVLELEVFASATSIIHLMSSLVQKRRIESGKPSAPYVKSRSFLQVIERRIILVD